MLLRGSRGRWHAVAVPAGLAVAEEPVVADGGGGLWFAGHLGGPGTGSGEEDDYVTEHTAIQLYGSLG